MIIIVKKFKNIIIIINKIIYIVFKIWIIYNNLDYIFYIKFELKLFWKILNYYIIYIVCLKICNIFKMKKSKSKKWKYLTLLLETINQILKKKLLILSVITNKKIIIYNYLSKIILRLLKTS